MNNISILRESGFSCMIDYTDVGSRIRAIRLERKMTQEQLAEAVNLGVTHISHIETGSSIPSLQSFIAILNALHCSADELLCRELTSVPEIRDHWLVDLIADCSTEEIKVISDTLKAVKESLRKNFTD